MASNLPGAGGRGLIGLGSIAAAYITVDIIREREWLPSAIAELLQPVLWTGLAVSALLKAPRYPHWPEEFRAAPKFFACLAFVIFAIMCEVIMVQFVTVVLGLDWHNETSPLPDTGQWILLSLNERLPPPLTSLLRARLIELHHFLFLFVLLGFSVLFNCIPPPGLGLAARYAFTMGVGRILRFLTFAATILPAVRPWCAQGRFGDMCERHPHPWAQKYYLPYAKNHDMIYHLLTVDKVFAPVPPFPPEYTPDWGPLQFLLPFLRPIAPPPSSPGDRASRPWVIRPGGGCNDLAYSGHVLVAVLTACAWQEAFPGWSSLLLWLLTIHSGQREIRERQHYSVDVIAAFYMGVLLWWATGFLWSRPKVLKRDEAVQNEVGKKAEKLMKASKDGDMEAIRNLLQDAHEEADHLVTSGSSRNTVKKGSSSPFLWVAGAVFIVACVGIALVIFHLTVGG